MTLGNLYLGSHCVDLLNFGVSQTPSLVSTPKFSKNSTSTTTTTSIVIRVANQLRIRRESKRIHHCETCLWQVVAIQTKIKSARSANQFKSFCFVLLLQKVESSLTRHCEANRRFAQSNPKKNSSFKNLLRGGVNIILLVFLDLNLFKKRSINAK